MASMDPAAYRREVRMFRGELTNTAVGAGRRTLKGAGHQWYKVKAEPGLSLYHDTANLYMQAFRNSAGCYKFYNEANPAGRHGGIINAQTLSFLGSYNSSGGRDGLGRPQDQNTTVTLHNLNEALTAMASATFVNKTADAQRDVVAVVVIGLVEAARFTDVEDAVVNSTVITDRRWSHHGNAAAVFIQPPA